MYTSTTLQHNSTTVQQYNRTTVQPYNSTTVQQYRSTKVQQYNSNNVMWQCEAILSWLIKSWQFKASLAGGWC